MAIFLEFHPIFAPIFIQHSPIFTFSGLTSGSFFCKRSPASYRNTPQWGNIRNKKKGNPGKDCPLYFLENSITKLEIKLPSPRAEKPDCPINSMEDKKDKFLHQFASRSTGVVEALHLGIHLLHLGNNLHHLHSIIISHSCRIIAHTPG